MTDQPAAPTSPERLAERLTSDGQRTLEFFRGLTPDQWKRVVYSEGAGWKVSQVLAHLVSSEAANAQVVENIIAGGPGAPADFEINQFFGITAVENIIKLIYRHNQIHLRDVRKRLES